MANECIPFYRPGADITALATAAVVGKTFVDLSAAASPTLTAGGNLRVATATAAGKAFGVAAYDALISTRVPVVCGPGVVVPVTAGGTIAYNTEVEVGAGGKAVAYASGIKVGLALEAGTNNNDVAVQLY